MNIKSASMAVLLTLGMGGVANGADTATGKKLAEALCSNCHIVAPGQGQGTVTAGVPSFMAVAQKEAQTPEKIAGYIIIPHPPMPEIQLTRHDIANIAAYIMTLKE